MINSRSSAFKPKIFVYLAQLKKLLICQLNNGVEVDG